MGAAGDEVERELASAVLAHAPVIDAEQSARKLIEEFGTFGAAVAAPLKRLERVCGGDAAAVDTLRTFRRAMLHVLRSPISQRPVVTGSSALLDYLQVGMAHATVEIVRILHLNCRNMLIKDEVVSRGTIDGATLHVREIIARALELGSSGLILVHNHPSGDPAPTDEDVAATLRLRQAAQPMGILLHDHVVVGSEGCASMRAMGLL